MISTTHSSSPIFQPVPEQHQALNLDQTVSKSRHLLNISAQLTEPLLSIAIPTYKRFDLLAEALDSVFSLNFEFPVEILVVDNDPENDFTALQAMERFKDKPLLYFKNTKNLGMFGNWNQCLCLARGQYITILHDDDLLLPAFAGQLNSLLGNPTSQLNIIGFQCDFLDQRKNRPVAPKRYAISALKHTLLRFTSRSKSNITRKNSYDLFFSNPFCGTLGIVMNRKKAMAIRGFNANWYPIADYEFWCRWVTLIGDISIIKTSVGLYRMRENESMRPETRLHFVSVSRTLRQEMIARGTIPVSFTLLLSPLTKIQELLINDDWRTEGDAPITRLNRLLILLWRLLTFSVTRIATLISSSLSDNKAKLS